MVRSNLLSESSVQDGGPFCEAGLLAEWRQNRCGFAGLLLSILQLFLHGGWMHLSEWLVRTGRVEDAPASSWRAWLISAALVFSLTVTMVALFLSIVGATRERPRTPACVGIVLSFFAGSFVTFALLLSILTGSGRG